MGSDQPTREPGPAEVDEELLSILACPACHTPVEKLDTGLLCRDCGRLYPIRDGIPIMLIEEAERPEHGASRAADSGHVNDDRSASQQEQS